MNQSYSLKKGNKKGHALPYPFQGQHNVVAHCTTHPSLKFISRQSDHTVGKTSKHEVCMQLNILGKG